MIHRISYIGGVTNQNSYMRHLGKTQYMACLKYLTMMTSQKQERILHYLLQTDSNHFQCRNHNLHQFGFLAMNHFIENINYTPYNGETKDYEMLHIICLIT